MKYANKLFGVFQVFKPGMNLKALVSGKLSSPSSRQRESFSKKAYRVIARSGSDAVISAFNNQISPPF